MDSRHKYTKSITSSGNFSGILNSSWLLIDCYNFKWLNQSLKGNFKHFFLLFGPDSLIFVWHSNSGKPKKTD
jgi:hypothetical protein